MNIRKWLCALLAVAMLCAMLPTALMEEVTASDVDAQTEEVAFELGGEPEPEEGEPVEENDFELTAPEPEDAPVVSNGLPRVTAYDGKFAVDDGVLVWVDQREGDLVIPDTVTDLYTGAVATVLELREGLFAEEKWEEDGEEFYIPPAAITSVSIPMHVRRIGQFAFQGCDKLTKVTFAEGSYLEEVGEAAFEGCTSLATIAFPNDDIEFGGWCFIACDALNDAAVEGILKCTRVVPNDAFSWCHSLKNLTVPANIREIRDGAFEDVSNLETVTIAGGVENICDHAFHNDEKLKTVTIEMDDGHIDSHAFENCPALETVTLEGVEGIDDRAFADCSGLKKVTLPTSLRWISRNAFEGCNNPFEMVVNCGEDSDYNGDDLRSCVYEYNEKIKEDELVYRNGAKIVIGDKCEKIPNGCFWDDSGEITKVDATILKPSVTTIGDDAFANCQKIKTIEIPDTLLHIYGDVFRGCQNLEGVTINPAADADYNVWNLISGTNLNDDEGEGRKKVKLSSSAKAVPGYFYDGLWSLTAIDASLLPASVVSIGECAFKNCEMVKTITIPANVKKIGERAFDNCSFTTATIPATVTHVGYGIFANCDLLETVTVVTGAIDQYDDDNALYYDSLAYRAHNLKKITLGEGSKCVPDGFFTGHAELKDADLALPATVTAIGDFAYAGCTGLTRLEIANKETTVGMEAIPGTVTIKCYSGSPAEEYALANGNPIEYFDPVSHMQIAFAKGDSYEFTGAAVEPELTVTYNGKALVKGTDYAVAYANNVAIGENTATATVTGLGAYAGSGEQVLKFSIVQKTLKITGKKMTVTEARGMRFQILPPDGATISKITGTKKNVSALIGTDVIEALGAGKCNIKVKCSDKKTYTIALTVVDPTQVQSVTFQAVPASVKVNETITLKWTMGPDGCDTSIKSLVSSGKKNVNLVVDAASQSATFTATKKGTYTVTLTPNNPAKKGMKAKIKIKVVP